MFKGFLALALALFIIALGFIAAEMMKSKGAKWLASISGVALAVLALAIIIPDGLSKQSGTYVPSASKTTEKEKIEESKNLTLRNFRRKGDSMDITCTGATGNIQCKPK